jgi:hypothetical protein
MQRPAEAAHDRVLYLILGLPDAPQRFANRAETFLEPALDVFLDVAVCHGMALVGIGMPPAAG